MGRLIVITSGKGGVGKTTSAINLGASLNSFGKDVIVVDANLTTPNVGLHLGAPVVPIAFQHVLSGKHKAREAIYEHHSGTKIMPASLSLESLKGIKEENFNKIAKQLKKMSEIIIFDSAAGLGREVELVMNVADELVIITNPELPAVTDALKAIKLAEDLGKSVTGVIITRSRDTQEMNKTDIQALLERPIIGIIPEDSSVREALMRKDAVVHTHPNSDAAIAYKKIAARLIGRKYIPHEKPSFMTRFFEKLGFR